MSEQLHHRRHHEEEASELPTQAKQDFDVDELLDDIDAILEDNAANFVQGFVQKGGQ